MAEIATENKAPSSGKKLKVWLIVLAAVLIVGGVVLFLKIKSDRDEALRQSIIGSGTFHPGITVAGVDISGMTPDEAAEALKGAEQSLVQDVSFRITRDEKSRTFSSNSKRSYILRTSSRSRRLILSSIVSFAVWLKCTRTI